MKVEGGFVTGNAGGGKVEVRRSMRGKRKRPGEKSPGGEVLMARRGGIRDDGGWPVRSRGEDGESRRGFGNGGGRRVRWFRRR